MGKLCLKELWDLQRSLPWPLLGRKPFAPNSEEQLINLVMAVGCLPFPDYGCQSRGELWPCRIFYPLTAAGAHLQHLFQTQALKMGALTQKFAFLPQFSPDILI